MTEIPPPAKLPTFSKGPGPRWAMVTMALTALAGSPVAVSVVQAWRAPDPPPPPVTAIEWEAAEKKLDRLVTLAEAEQRLRNDQIEALRKTDERLEAAIERLDPRPNRTRLTR